MEGKGNVASLGLTLGSDGRRDRASLFQHSEGTQERSCSPRVALWFYQLFELSNVTQRLPAGPRLSGAAQQAISASLQGETVDTAGCSVKQT